MARDLNELIEKRGKLFKQMTDILDRGRSEGRSLSAEENETYNKLENEYDNLSELQEKEERHAKREAQMNALITKPVELPGASGKEGRSVDPADKEKVENRQAFQRFLRGGVQVLTPAEHRALQADQDIYGGFLVPPMEVLNDLIQAIDNRTFLRGLATVDQIVTAMSLGIPTLDADPDDADWTAEVATGSEDSAMKFGGRELNPHPLAKRIKISAKLLRATSNKVETKVMERLAYKFAVSQEKGYLTGSGSNQPLGVFTASSNGISTGRDVSTDNTTTNITGDGLINAKYTLKEGYHSKAAWIFHRDVVRNIRKLKDGNGQYIWAPGLQQGQPDRILDLPFYMSEYAPNTFTTGLYVGILGDFTYYHIVEALSMTVQRLNELYAEKNQVGYIGRMEIDGMPVLEEAFVRVKLA